MKLSVLGKFSMFLLLTSDEAKLKVRTRQE